MTNEDNPITVEWILQTPTNAAAVAASIAELCALLKTALNHAAIDMAQKVEARQQLVDRLKTIGVDAEIYMPLLSLAGIAGLADGTLHLATALHYQLQTMADQGQAATMAMAHEGGQDA